MGKDLIGGAARSEAMQITVSGCMLSDGVEALKWLRGLGTSGFELENSGQEEAKGRSGRTSAALGSLKLLSGSLCDLQACDSPGAQREVTVAHSDSDSAFCKSESAHLLLLGSLCRGPHRGRNEPQGTTTNSRPLAPSLKLKYSTNTAKNIHQNPQVA